MVIAGMAFLMLAATVAYSAGDPSPERRTLWDKRNSTEAIEVTAKQFLGMLVLDEYDMKVNRLSFRPELVEVSRLTKERKYPQALAAFENYTLNKLRYPHKFGLSPEDIDPYAFLPPSPERAKVLSEADRLMQHTLIVDGKPVDIGAPGTVNWNYPFGPDEAVPVSRLVAGPLSNPMGGFAPLVQAFLLTHNKAYLEKWAAYLDDWSLNAHYVDSIHPCYSPTALNATLGYYGPIGFIRQLAALANALPLDQQPLPPAVLARVMRKFMTQRLLYVVYIRSNVHNWTPNMYPLLTALIYDEFKITPEIFREARRRNIEDHAVTQNLRDGTENQQCPWYNRNYLYVKQVFPMLKARVLIPDWQEQPWVLEMRGDMAWRREIQEHLNAHVNWFIRGRTAQNEWPAAFRGGTKNPAEGVSSEWFHDTAPEAYQDSENARIVAAIIDPASGLRPTHTDDWFPYGGYNIVREGWEKDSGYGAMFCSPKPGAYGAFRSRGNNNTFAVAAFGQDLLVEDNPQGRYAHLGSPITVDGKQQFFHAGVYNVPDPIGHKAYLVSAWTEPANWRWHSSPRFSLMEGVYAGPFADLGKCQPAQPAVRDVGITSRSIPFSETLQGVTHQRLVHYLRSHRLWLVTDRMVSDQPHTYEQAWCFPMQPGPYSPFDREEIKVDAAAHRIYTDAKDREENKKLVPHANVSLYQFTSAPVSYTSQEWIHPAVPGRDYRAMYGWRKMKTAWQGAGTQQMITVIQPRKPGSGSEAELKTVKQLTGPEGVTGCELTLPDGAVVRYLAAPNSDGELALGNLLVRGEALLLDGNSGLVLGCKTLTLNGRHVELKASDFEFTLKDGALADLTPIYRPIDPVRILPERNVFVDRLEITLVSRTPGVEIHYTLDGSDPTPQSPRYTGPFTLVGSATVKTRAYRPGVITNPVQQSGTHATVASMAVFTKAEPSAPVVSKAQPGLQYRYYEDDWKSLWLFRDELNPKKTGSVSALFDPSFLPADNPPVGEAVAPRAKYYSVVYTGFLKVPENGVYTFHAPREYVMPDTDAGYELQLYLGASKTGPTQWYPATRLHALGNWSVALKAGLHPFKVVYVDYRTDAPKRLNLPGINDYIWAGVMPDLRISGAGLDRQPIPAEWLWRAP